MFDPLLLPPEGPPSAFEAVLRARLSTGPVIQLIPARVVVDIDYRPHGRRATTDDEPGPEWRSFAGRLDAGAAHLRAARSAYEEQCRQAAVQARHLAAFATERPGALLDRPDDEVGAAAAASRAARPAALTAVSEWAVDEVMCAFGLSSTAATALLAESLTLVQQLPATLTALESARISWNHARMLTEVLAPLKEGSRAEVETRLLARAAGKTVSQLKAAARREVLRVDAAAAARRLALAIRDRNVRMYPGEDGMASLATTLPVPVALACTKAIEDYAEACRTPDDERTKDQRMADCFVDLILRSGASDAPPVRIDLTVVAGVATLQGGDEPGEVEGHPVPAVVVRELADALGLLPRAEEPPARARLADLLRMRTTTGTALAKRPTVAVVDEVSGQLLALTSATEILRIANGNDGGLGPPADTPGYSPSAALDRFVRARDRRCLFPGCRAAAIRCDLDHNVPWPAGPTSAGNLCCLCRHHHRLSHQAPGWRMRRLPDGGLEWTTPGGERLTTHPARYGSDDDLPPPEPTARKRPTLAELVLGKPRPPGPDPDPPGF